MTRTTTPAARFLPVFACILTAGITAPALAGSPVASIETAPDFNGGNMSGDVEVLSVTADGVEYTGLVPPTSVTGTSSNIFYGQGGTDPLTLEGALTSDHLLNFAWNIATGGTNDISWGQDISGATLIAFESGGGEFLGMEFLDCSGTPTGGSYQIPATYTYNNPDGAWNMQVATYTSCYGGTTTCGGPTNIGGHVFEVPSDQGEICGFRTQISANPDPKWFAAPTPARFVTSNASPARDSFEVCDKTLSGWSCETVTLPAWAGYLRGDTKGVQFEAIDANDDGQVGFITFAEHALHCEPDASTAEGWSCAWLTPDGANNGRRIGDVEKLDLDGDGYEDIVYTNNLEGPEVCYGGSFPMVCEDLTFLSGASYRATDYADFDGDGVLDVFVSYNKPWATGYSKLCLGDAQDPTAFTCRDFTESNTSYLSTATGAEPFDADGDGYMDLFVQYNAAYGQAGELCLNDASNPGSFSCVQVDMMDIHYQGSFWGEGSTEVHAADFDGDGNEDLAVATRGMAGVCWSDGAGALDCDYLDGVTSYSEIETGAQSSLDIGDLDRDGDLDLIVGHKGLGMGVQECLNDNAGAFACAEVNAPARYHGVAVLF